MFVALAFPRVFILAAVYLFCPESSLAVVQLQP